MKEIQCLHLLGHWKGKGSKSINKISAWQLAYPSEKGNFWDDCQWSLYISHETKPQNTPALSAPGPCPAAECCSWLALGAAPCPRDWHPLLTLQEGGAHSALTLSLGSFHQRYGFSLAHTLTGSFLQPRLAMEWKTGGWTSQDVFQSAKMGMCSVLVRNKDLLGSRNCANLY